MEVQCEFLVSNPNDHKTITLVKEKIRHISDGSSSHRADALQLGLEKAFELKKRKRELAYCTTTVIGVAGTATVSKLFVWMCPSGFQ